MFGDNLSGFKIQVLIGESADDLQAQLAQIRVPYKIFNIYGVGNRHYAWITANLPIKVRKTKNKEIKDGSIS